MYGELTTIQSPASRAKIGQAKKPQAECLDRRELTKNQSGLSLRLSFTVSSRLWLCQKNEGSEGTCLPLPYNQIASTLPLHIAVCTPKALRSGSVK